MNLSLLSFQNPGLGFKLLGYISKDIWLRLFEFKDADLSKILAEQLQILRNTPNLNRRNKTSRCTLIIIPQPRVGGFFLMITPKELSPMSLERGKLTTESGKQYRHFLRSPVCHRVQLLFDLKIFSLRVETDE